MICLLEERVCNLVLLWCITVIAHYCKLVKLQSANSDYHKQSDLWNYDDIEFSRPQNETNIRYVKPHHTPSFYSKPSTERKSNTHDNFQDDIPIIRGQDNLAARTSIDVPVGLKMNDGEILISKKITFNGNNSRSNNHQLWFNTLEKNAMSLPSLSYNNFKNAYAERKVESTKRPYEGPGSIFATKPIPLNMNGTGVINRNKIKYQPSYEPEYDEPALPPSLPNLEIIPFVASDALDKPKDTMIDRKESLEYETEETTLINDSGSQVKKFSPPVRTEGGFVPRDPSLDDLYFKTEYNRTYSTPSTTETTTQLYPKVSEIVMEEKEYSSPPTTEKSTPQTTRPPSSTTEEIITSTSTTQTAIHFIETTATSSTLPQLNSTTTTSTPKIELHTTEDPDEYEEDVTESEPEPEPPLKTTNHTKEEPNAEPEDNSLLNNILTMIFDDYPTTKPKPTTKKTIYTTRPTTPMPKTTTTIPPFKHLFIPTTENSTVIRNEGKIEFNSTKLFGNNNTVINDSQQNLIKYITTRQTTTIKPVTQTIKMPSYSANEIFSSMKTDSVISGLLKLSGCNIFGKMYKIGELIDELSESCSRCICSETGVHCIPVKC